MKRAGKVGFTALAVLAAACSDNDMMAPSPVMLAEATTEQCETIDFEGLAHGDVPGVGNTVEIFGNTLSFSADLYEAWLATTQGATSPRVFDTKHPRLSEPFPGTGLEDRDLAYPWEACAGCLTDDIGNILVLPDNEQGWDPYGDYRWGGLLTISGFSGGPYYVKSFKAVDDDGGEPSIDLYADGDDTKLIGQSTGLGDHRVELVSGNTTVTFGGSLVFEFGTEVKDNVTGSGGVDDIVICRLVDEPPPPPSGEGTRTPGYWKNDKKDWPADNITIGGVSYTRAEADDLMEHPTAKDKTYNLFEHLVAAKLNLLNGTEASCISGVVAEADAWMAEFGPVGSGVEAKDTEWKDVQPGYTMSAAAMHTTLDHYNNGLLCAPKAD